MERWKGTLDPCGAGDDAIFYRNIQIYPHDDGFPGDVDIIERAERMRRTGSPRRASLSLTLKRKLDFSRIPDISRH
ncbi:MAG: hypothetical protein AB7G08_27785 [Hyphomicrobiaceae bacterium]